MTHFLERFLHHFHTPFTNSVLIFAVILFIILLLPLLFNRFKIPGIIGLILSGIIIGPEGFNLIQKNSAVELFSTIGLLYIMFIAGLELDLVLFKKNKNKSIVFGTFTFLIPIALGFPICYFILGYDVATSLLASSMLATHTLIAYPIVTRLGISQSQVVSITVGGTILADTAVLLLLAVISGARLTGLTMSFFVEMGISLTIFLLVVTVVIPKIAAWFFKRLEDEKYAHFIFILSMVFFSAFLAELCGLEPIIGALAAGLALNRLVPHHSSLMNRIEFVGNSIFIPFFLISVGMLIDVRVIFTGGRTVAVAALLITVALTGKWLAAQLTRLLFKYSKSEGNLIFGLSSSRAAATLAVALVGYNIRLIDDAILNGTVILILVTCIVASFVTEKAGKKLLIEADVEPEEAEQHESILVPIANPDTMERLIDLALLMKSPKDPLPIIALSVVKDNEQARSRLVHAKKMLNKAMEHAAAADSQIEIMATIDRNVSNGIRRIATEKFITAIVLGWSDERKNLADIIFGKTYDSLLKQTHQTIFITRFVAPLNIQQNLILICGAFADKEIGFFKWLKDVLNVAYHLRTTILLHATIETYASIQEFIAVGKLNVEINYNGMIDLGEVATLKRQIKQSDMIVVAGSRDGGISYSPVLDILPRKMARTFERNNLIFIYPSSVSDVSISNYEQQSTGGLLEKGIEIFKSARSIFTRS